jgi:O-acetyl-ADP-ribose deacetylase (regulator of RNase III)
MILYVEGNIFQSPAQVLVNTVNTVGVMGKGIALEFKQLFPEMYEQYRSMCEQNLFDIGILWLYKSPNKWVLNFPTKKHWRQPSRLEYIEKGLQKFVDSYAKLGIYSIAFPALGYGNGQLDFNTEVQPLMEKYFRNLPIEVFIYPDKKSAFVEHLNKEEMKLWLRSEPTALPFNEVWDDLVQLIKQKVFFKTVSRETPFKAEISENPLGIKILTENHSYQIRYEVLLKFWQQLRTHGFTMRHIAPGVDRKISYLTSIFSDLEYVTSVSVTDNYGNSQSSIVTGLQILPSAFARQPKHLEQPIQLTLFG